VIDSPEANRAARPRSGGAHAVSGVSIRPAGTRDLDRVAEIERASFGDPWTRRSFDALLGDPRVWFQLATLRDGRVVAYVVAWFVGDEGEIANLAVAAEVRGRGVGALLLDATIRAARARSVGSLYLEVRESNALARALYASRGFQQVGRRRRYYRQPAEDALVLQLALAPS
jgi:ribosomal-protein-alanine N-acetyltransferase